MKKLTAALLAAIMILTLIPTAAYAAKASFGLKAESDGTTVLLSWDKVSGAEKYTVYYSKSPVDPDSMTSLGSFKSLKLKVRKLKSGVTYEFKIVSDNGNETAILSITPETGKKKSEAVYPDDGIETAAEAAKKFGAGINIGNAFDSCGSWLPKNASVKQFEEAWGNPQTSQTLIKAIKKAGFGAIRLPVTWNYVSDSAGNIRDDWMDRVQEVVDWILNEDMYCIINVHHDTGTDGWIHASENSYKNGSARFKKIWEQIAERFKDYDEKLLFECMNETLNDSNDWNSKNSNDYKVINKWEQIFVDTVRASGGNNATRNLVVNTYAASSNSDIINSFELPKDTTVGHMILQVHNYDPQGFTWKNVGYDTERSTWGTNQDKTNMENFLKMLSKKAEELGVPAIVGEFSSDNKNNESERAKHAFYMYSKAKEYGITVFWWDNGDHNGCRIINRSDGTVTMPKIVKAIMEAVN